jgi:hypothetical protein
MARLAPARGVFGVQDTPYTVRFVIHAWPIASRHGAQGGLPSQQFADQMDGQAKRGMPTLETGQNLGEIRPRRHFFPIFWPFWGFSGLQFPPKRL